MFTEFLTIGLERLKVKKVDRDLQKYRHLQMSFTYDVIDVFPRRTIYGMVSKIL